MTQDLERLAIDTIRALAMDAVQKANSGHPGTPMALAPLGLLLFTRLRRHDPAHPNWPDRDRFVLSAGHACMLQYALLYLTGYDLPLEEIERFRQWESKTPGHPELHHTPGVEATTGPLGQGFGNAVGMAMAERHLAARFNRPDHTIFDHRTWVIASDGDMMEGVSSEAASLAGHLGLGKLIVFWDDNRITIDGSTELTFSEKVLDRFGAYGWHTETVPSGNDLSLIEKAVRSAEKDLRPSLISVRTIIADPAPTKKNTAEAHGAPLGEEEVRRTKEIMGWPMDRPFMIPPEMKSVREAALERGRTLFLDWKARLERYARAYPSEARELETTLEGKLSDGWDQGLPQFESDKKGMATRKASQAVLAELVPRLPNLVGGSADLAASNLTLQKGEASMHENLGVPRNVHFGVREHAMGAALNGMAAHGGVVPYGATFLIFSDYMRPSIRLAALSELRVRYVFTHDSIGLGEDGPTHQPVEHLAALRAMPNLNVIRPCDANEVREAWKAALLTDGPAALVLSRQSVPTLDRTALAKAENLHRGAYVLFEPEGGPPEVILIASGTEVSIALEGARILEGESIRARVVSMPSWTLFERQDADYQNRVLPPSVEPRVVVEAATRFGWERWAGARSAYVTVERFGASAPSEVIYEKLGITPGNVAKAARRVLGA